MGLLLLIKVKNLGRRRESGVNQAQN